MIYRVIKHKDITPFEMNVNLLLQSGYVPQGGVVVDGAFFVQAMTKGTSNYKENVGD